MKKRIKYMSILLIAIFFIFNYAMATNDVLQKIQDDSAPSILPDFINEGADKQIENWENIFGDEFIDIINAMEAVKTGDVQTFIQSGVNILKVTSRILPKLGLDLIIPVNDNYLGNIKIDPTGDNSGLELGSQKLVIDNFESLEVENLVLNLALSGYNTDFIQVKRIINEGVLELVSDNITAKTKLIISLDKGEIFINNNGGQDKKKIKKLPSYALREVKTRYKKFNEEDIKLEIINDKLTYLIDGYIDGKILWIIPIKVDMQAEYDAEKGSLVSINKPWWEIFIF